MQKTKKCSVIMCLFWAAVMIASIIILLSNSVIAGADSAGEDYYNYTLITNEDGSQSYKVALKAAYRSTIEYVNIADTYNDLPVTEIAANGFISCSKLRRVTLPKTVTKIGNYAFRNCAELIYIGMPSVESIGNSAFALCTSLDKLYFSDKIKVVGTNVLQGNNNSVYVQSTEIL